MKRGLLKKVATSASRSGRTARSRARPAARKTPAGPPRESRAPRPPAPGRARGEVPGRPPRPWDHLRRSGRPAPDGRAPSSPAERRCGGPARPCRSAAGRAAGNTRTAGDPAPPRGIPPPRTRPSPAATSRSRRRCRARTRRPAATGRPDCCTNNSTSWAFTNRPLRGAASAAVCVSRRSACHRITPSAPAASATSPIRSRKVQRATPRNTRLKREARDQ